MSFGRPAFLLRQLVELAGREGELLAAGDWEQALTVRDEFDEAFAQLQAAVQYEPLSPAQRNDVVRLQQLQLQNMELMRGLSEQARAQLGEISQVAQLSSYAPLGRNHRPTPRYLDESA